jgi:hypothetical protein
VRFCWLSWVPFYVICAPALTDEDDDDDDDDDDVHFVGVVAYS